jgi:hypothetical protein
VVFDLLGGVLGDRDELLAAAGPEASHVEQQARRLAGLAVDSEPAQLLERLERRTARPDEGIEAASDDLHHRTTVLHEFVDVAVEVQDVEEAFDVVSGDLTLPEQVGLGWLFKLRFRLLEVAVGVLIL